MIGVAGHSAVDPIGGAVDRLAAGGLVAYPTEGAWGLGAAAAHDAAVATLCAWKGRERSQPLSVLVSGAGPAAALGCRLDPAAQRLVERLWPGPLTLVLPREPGARPLASGVCRADGALGLRCSSHPVARALAVESERRGLGPITATSFNRRGEPAARTRSQAQALASEPAPVAVLLLELADADAFGGEDSTIVDLVGPVPRLLREGAVPRGELVALLATELAAPDPAPPPVADRAEPQEHTR